MNHERYIYLSFARAYIIYVIRAKSDPVLSPRVLDENVQQWITVLEFTLIGFDRFTSGFGLKIIHTVLVIMLDR